jgi:hypothetical protein
MNMEKYINEITGLLDEARSDIYPAWAKSEIRMKIDALEKHLKDINHHNNAVAHKIETARVYLDKLFKIPVRVDRETNIIFNPKTGVEKRSLCS